VYQNSPDFLGHKKAFTINDWTYIFGDRLTAVRVCARAVEKTDSCFTSQCHVLRRKCSFIKHLVLYLEENTKKAAGLSMAMKFLPEERAVFKHK